MMCSSDGFPYNFEIYCGKETNREGPLGSHVVKKSSHQCLTMTNMLYSLIIFPQDMISLGILLLKIFEHAAPSERTEQVAALFQ